MVQKQQTYPKALAPAYPSVLVHKKLRLRPRMHYCYHEYLRLGVTVGV